MTTTIMLAQVIGIAYIVMGVSFLLNPTYNHKAIMDFVNNKGLLFITGIFTLVLGYFMVTYHNIWGTGLEIIVSIICWIAFVKGIVIVLFPELMENLSMTIFKKINMTVMGVLVLVFGLILGYFGFMA